jgi:hypothetical protein
MKQDMLATAKLLGVDATLRKPFEADALSAPCAGHCSNPVPIPTAGNIRWWIYKHRCLV